jgi:hypothetical protein
MVPSRCRRGHSEGAVGLRRDIGNGSRAAVTTVLSGSGVTPAPEAYQQAPPTGAPGQQRTQDVGQVLFFPFHFVRESPRCIVSQTVNWRDSPILVFAIELRNRQPFADAISERVSKCVVEVTMDARQQQPRFGIEECQRVAGGAVQIEVKANERDW